MLAEVGNGGYRGNRRWCWRDMQNVVAAIRDGGGLVGYENWR